MRPSLASWQGCRKGDVRGITPPMGFARFRTEVHARLRMRFLAVASASVALVLVVTAGVARPAAQAGVPETARSGYDTVLDTYVRDGLVYYRALKSDRRKLDGFVTALGTAAIATAPKPDQMAFWLNAYNALVLRSVIDQYPIPVRSKEYPARSIRQIPGVFERTPHRVAGRTLTLDQIEQTVLTTFNEPRLFLALGRGAVGSGRLRSEPYTGADLERQLADIAAECVHRSTCIDLDRGANAVRASSVFSWRERDFTAAYADKADPKFASRSPIERAVLGFIAPKLLTTEEQFLERNEFTLRFQPFDWTLNDLTGR